MSSLVVGAVIFRCLSCQSMEIDRRGVGLVRCAPCRKVYRDQCVDRVRLYRALKGVAHVR